ncbi:MAG: TonB-dependent siderophore receptor [Rhodoferax sp.]|nr:TonB-dependent siderophore receptor [Rhodoferax sp.]MDP3650490.1 TonB-dependent siderophore receptor [Rhodoferax sp.]
MQSHPPRIPARRLAIALALAYASLPSWAQSSEKSLAEVTVLGTAEETLKQASGVSVIGAQDIEKHPPANDLSEIIRTMPGVNLTGNSTSGQRGNNRQIDLRGMGPENTLILVDGKPVSSRNAVRYGWRGERDSRGDSNWVPAQQVERIEVIRGPAAARYGSGAAGGVVNIVTKKATKETHGQLTVYANAPEHAEEGATRRMNFSLSGPLAENFSYRLYGNANETGADGTYINAGHQAPGFATTLPAGREGVRNRDLGAQLSWNLLPGHTLDLDLNYGRQGNIYTGDTQNINSNSNVETLRGQETNALARRAYALTHKGKFDFGTSLSYVQRSETDNTRIQEGLAGGTEGIFLAGTPAYLSNQLEDVTAHSELNLPLRGRFNQMLTVGAEWSGQKLKDPSSNTQATTFGTIPGVSSTGRSPDASAHTVSVFAEDNVELSPNLLLTPGIRYDNHTQSGANWSPALNLTYLLGEKITLKGGIARAYKTPNLYQSNPNYLLYSSGNGCVAVSNGTTGCYLQGNPDLKAETSDNKELGIEFKDGGFAAGVTWFRNDYRDKVQAGTTPVGIITTTTAVTRSLYQWTNIPEAVVQGLEGNLRVPVNTALDWVTNVTYLIESRNKTTGDYLSVIPEYTINSMLDWRVSDTLGALFSVTLYGKQEAMKLDYKGKPVTGTSADALAPYAIASLSGNYSLSKHLKLGAGVNNIFDKRQFRAGNAVSVSSTAVYGTSGGAGAATYNEPGRTLYVSLTSTF